MSGCTATAAGPRYDDDVVARAISGNLATEAPRAEMPSLFREDEAVMSSDDVARAMAWKLVAQDKAKLAVVRVGQMPYWWGWSPDFVRLNEQIDSEFLSRLSSSNRVSEVAYLPSMVTPRDITIPKLRQAAARFQADLLLIYRTSTRSYDREKFLAPGETRAYCTVEAVLLDTRSGIIPFSAIANETFAAKRTSADIDFSETVAKANQQAIARAWLKVADQVNGYFDKLPAAETRQVNAQPQ